MKLNLACGDRPREGYLNLDIVPGKGEGAKDCLRLDMEDDSVDEILAEHFIEHLTRPELDLFFSQAKRLLRAGGKIVLRAPCMQCCIRAVEAGELSLELADDLLFARHLHEHNFHRQGIWEGKLRRLCEENDFHQPEFTHGPDYEISMTSFRKVHGG